MDEEILHDRRIEDVLHDRRALNDTILTLLEENRDDIKLISDSVNETHTLISEVNAHFIGIAPGDHIKHHLKLEQDEKNKNENISAQKSVLVTVGGAILIGLGSIIYTSVVEHIRHDAVIETAVERLKADKLVKPLVILEDKPKDLTNSK